MDHPRLTFTYGTVDELPLDLDVYLPVINDNTLTGPIPTVVWIHGGGGFAGDKSPEKNPRWFPFWMKGNNFP